jgi:hypothetical protein
MKNRNFLGNIFQAIADVLNGAERSFLDLLSVLAPYFVPLPAAYLTYYHSVTMLEFPAWLGWTNAFVIETLGLASVSTAIRFYRNNRNYKSEKEHAPFSLAVFVYVFYLVCTISLNVILEIVSGTRGGWIIFSIALFTLLSVPSGILISIRSLYTEILGEREDRKAERREDRRPRWDPKLVPNNQDVPQEELSDGKSFRRNK